jgi:hypothetical protein
MLPLQLATCQYFLVEYLLHNVRTIPNTRMYNVFNIKIFLVSN